MSKSNKMEVTCPKCNKKSDKIIWHSVNVSADPRLKKSVLDGSIFDFICQYCDEKFTLVYECLYHDMDKDYLIYLIPDNETDDQIENIVDLTSKYQGFTEGYKYRIVRSINRLKEKISIFDDDLDDIIIENMKMVANYHFTNDSNTSMGEIYYNEKKGDNLEFVAISDNDVMSFNIPLKLYKEFQKEEKINQPDKFVEINESNCNSFIVEE